MTEHTRRPIRHWTSVLAALFTFSAPAAAVPVIIVLIPDDTAVAGDQQPDQPAPPDARARGPPPTRHALRSRGGIPSPPPGREESEPVTMPETIFRRVTARHAEKNHPNHDQIANEGIPSLPTR